MRFIKISSTTTTTGAVVGIEDIQHQHVTPDQVFRYVKWWSPPVRWGPPVAGAVYNNMLITDNCLSDGTMTIICIYIGFIMEMLAEN